ncbi:VTT domain-containing protein [Clostridium estertheticum]|uniref:TVP38/TMEM64 family protein n=1 Tax=Clostridium estertheticum TaxID=238834 RepID=UPI001C0DA7AE|nr:VTT domain-containing protein [Clostridium estertheticum]MBU3179520.1 VTT domain-containing protein [Clostridium estertheticum]
MKKRNKLILMAIFWLVIVAVLYSQGLITTDVDKINEIIGKNPFNMRVLFVLLSTVRVLFFIPQTIFIIIGSMLFGPYVGFALSVLSLAMSQSIMYAIGRYFQNQLLGEEFLEKNKNTMLILKKYGYKILALGIACPVTPSDLITLCAACIKLNFKKCIAIIVMADAPMIFLYGFLGTGIQGTFLFKILAIVAITFVSYYTFVIWNKINSNLNEKDKTICSSIK